MVQSLDAPAPTQLAATTAQPQPVWSSDGNRIYFLGFGGVFAVSRAGGQPERVLAVSPGSAISSFHVSRDGKTLAIWRVDRSQKNGVRGSVWISSPPGAEPKEYTPHPFEVRGPFTPVYLRFSPDNKLLYLSMYTDAGAETWLLPIPAGSGTPRQIFEKVPWNRPVAASWMPDSRRLVLAGNPAPAFGATLWLADTRTESLTRLLADPDSGQTTPSVSPDGQRLLFTKMEVDRDIVELPLDGSPPRTLLATNLPEFAPTWSPSGDQFAYVTRRNGTDELWVRSTQGNWDRPVVTAKEFPTLEALLSPVFSPDGSRIAYTALLAGGGRRRSLAISPAGGGAPTIIADGYAPSVVAGWQPDRFPVDQAGRIDSGRDHRRWLGADTARDSGTSGSERARMVALRQMDRRLHVHGRDAGFSGRKGYAHAARTQQLGSGLVQRQQDDLWSLRTTAIRRLSRRSTSPPVRCERWPSTTSGSSPCN